jgi:site-specific recombinase XerD
MPKPRKRPLVIPPTETIEALLRSFTSAPTSVRNRAIVATMWRAGLRVSEVLALGPGDVDAERGTITVRRGKGGKARTVGIDAGGLALLAAWLAVRPRTGRAAPLFCTLGGQRVSASYVRSMLLRRGRRLGVAGLRPHAFRHAFAVSLVKEGFSMPHVQRLLGHSNLATTAQYLDSIGASEAVAAAAARQWRLDSQ